MTTSTLSGARVIVVGGSSGIGLAAVAAFAAAGAAVGAVGRDQAKLEQAVAPLGATAITADAADEAKLAAAFDRFGAFDHLVVAAGGGSAIGPFRDIAEDRFRSAFDAKFWVHVRCVRLAIGRVTGSITLVTGAAGRRAMAGLSGLAATNGALQAMVGPLALELAPVRVNAVSPGLIDTPYWGKMPADQREAMFAKSAASLPARRTGTAEDVAGAILFVAGNGFMSGSVIDCDGGARHV